MALVLPKYGAMGFDNLVRLGKAEIVSASGAKPLFPASRLLDPHWSIDWRTIVANVQQSVKIRLMEEALPTQVGLINCNIAAGQFATLVGADNEAMTTNAQAWVLTAYAQTQRRTLRWYLGNADLPPGAGLPHLYWQWIFPANGSTSDHYRVGNIWMSTYLDLVVGEDYDVTPTDPSAESVSDGGLSFFDVRDTFHQTSGSAPLMTVAEARAFRQKMDSLGRTNYVLLDYWARSSDDALKADGCYYGLLGRRGGEIANFRRVLPVRETMRYEFNEARG